MKLAIVPRISRKQRCEGVLLKFRGNCGRSESVVQRKEGNPLVQ